MPREKFIPNVGSRSTRRSHRSDNTSIPSENSHHQSRTVSVEDNSSQVNPTEKDSHRDEGRSNQSTHNNTSSTTSTDTFLPSIHDATRSRKRSTSSAKTAGQDVR